MDSPANCIRFPLRRRKSCTVSAGLLPAFCRNTSDSFPVISQHFALCWGLILHIHLCYDYATKKQMLFRVRSLKGIFLSSVCEGINMFQEYPDIVNVNQLRQMLGGIGQKAAYRLLHSGCIRYFKLGKAFRIPKKSIIEYLNSVNQQA